MSGICDADQVREFGYDIKATGQAELEELIFSIACEYGVVWTDNEVFWYLMKAMFESE